MRKKLIVALMVLAVSLPCMNAQSKESIEVPTEIVDITEQVANVYHVSKYILQAMAFVESTWNPDAVSKGHYGLYQVSVKYHKDRIEKFGYTTDDILFPYLNCLVATDYLMEIAEKYGEDGEFCEISLALDIYNGNSKAFENYENGILSAYSKKVLCLAEELEAKDESEISMLGM